MTQGHRGSRPGADRADALRQELDQLRTRVLGESGAVIRVPHPTPTRLHDLHRDLRRLHLGLTVWEELAGRPYRPAIARADARVRHLAQLVGQVRDRDVAIDLLTAVESSARAGPERERLERYRSRLRDDGRTGRELLRARLRAEAEGGLFDAIRTALAASVSPRGADRLLRLLEAHGRRLHGKLVTAHRRARRRPTMKRLHRLRIRLRRYRQLSDLTSALHPSAPASTPGRLGRLQQDLGHLHDLDVLWGSLEAELRRSRWATTLRAERKQLRDSLAERIELERPPRPPFRDGSAGR